MAVAIETGFDPHCLQSIQALGKRGIAQHRRATGSNRPSCSDEVEIGPKSEIAQRNARLIQHRDEAVTRLRQRGLQSAARLAGADDKIAMRLS
jgi:hypothetical protein